MLRLNITVNKHFHTLLRLWLLVVITALGACQHTSSVSTPWQHDILQYKHTLSDSDPDSVESIVRLPMEVMQQVTDLFSGHASKLVKANELAKWLSSSEGHGMHYDVNANLNPIDAFQQKKGNCLSFTILFASLAAELGVEIQYNLVDIPDVWSNTTDNALVLYRHINGVYKTVSNHHVFDLALDLYDIRFPQKTISQDQAIAQLHSNRAILELQGGNHSNALHLIKLAISLSPQNEDLWVNLGVISNRIGNIDLAEKSFLHAYSLNSKNEITASSLERFYTTHYQPAKAQQFQIAALKARKNNPYYLYETAKSDYNAGNYNNASSYIKKAISLHDEDTRFYELSSRIAQKLDRYDLALKDVMMAYQLSRKVNDQNRFQEKAKFISALVPDRQLQKILDQ